MMPQTTDRQRAIRFRTSSQHLRVSDADRSDIADRLARHYGDGRLDDAELDERLSRAMAAKTVADCQGLLADLPDIPGIPRATTAQPRDPMTRPRGRQRHKVSVLPGFLVLVFVAAAWHPMDDWHTPLAWLAVLAALIMLATRIARRQ